MSKITYDIHDEFEAEMTPSFSKFLREILPFKKYTIEVNFYTSAETMQQDLERIKSAVVIDSVIRENNLISKNAKLLTAEEFLKKDIIFENTKAENVLTVKYNNKDYNLAKKIIRSLINNFLE